MNRLLLIFAILIGAFDASATQWIKRADLPNVGRHRAVAIGLGNRGYVGLGHYNGTGVETYFNDWWAFDPSTNSWSQKAIYPGNNGNGELGCHAWTYDNKVYVGLGEIQHRVLFRYDPATNSWEQMTSAPSGINFQDTQEMAMDDYAYFTDVWNNQLYRYDNAGDSWQLIGPIPFAMNYSFSGFTYANNCWIKKDSLMYMYDTSQNIWYQVISAGVFPGSAVRGSAEFFLNDKFYVVCGYGNTFGEVTDEVWEFDPTTYLWTQLEDFSGTARRYTKAMVVSDKAYLSTGTNGTNLSDMWEFAPTLDINESDNLFEIKLYPNPTTDFLQVSIDNLFNFDVQVVDKQGRLLLTDHSAGGKTVLNTSILNNGTYYCKILKDGVLLDTKPFIVSQ